MLNALYAFSPSLCLVAPCSRCFPGGSLAKNLPANTRVRSPSRESPLEKKWQHTPVFLPGKSHGQGSLAGHKRLRHDLAMKQQQPCGRCGGSCKTTALHCPMCPHPLPVWLGHCAPTGLYPSLLNLGSLPYGPLVSQATWKLAGLR